MACFFVFENESVEREFDERSRPGCNLNIIKTKGDIRLRPRVDCVLFSLRLYFLGKQIDRAEFRLKGEQYPFHKNTSFAFFPTVALNERIGSTLRSGAG